RAEAVGRDRLDGVGAVGEVEQLDRVVAKRVGGGGGGGSQRGPGGIAADRVEELDLDTGVGDADQVRAADVGDPVTGDTRVVGREQGEGRGSRRLLRGGQVELDHEGEQGDVPLRPRLVGGLEANGVNAALGEVAGGDVDREVAVAVGQGRAG